MQGSQNYVTDKGVHEITCARDDERKYIPQILIRVECSTIRTPDGFEVLRSKSIGHNFNDGAMV